MEQTISSIDLYDTSSSGLVNFFNDPNSAIIFLLGIFVSSIFLIACTKVMYGPKKKETPKPVVKTQPKRKPRRKPAPKQGTQQRKPRQPKTKTKQ
tara:strand:- start:87 stop:371 length:285 start_codon:yes stop_codon:yes gene_type:complete